MILTPSGVLAGCQFCSPPPTIPWSFFQVTPISVSHMFTKWSETISRKIPGQVGWPVFSFPLSSLPSLLLIIRSPPSRPERLCSFCHHSLGWLSGAGLWRQCGESALPSYPGLTFIPYFLKQFSKLHRKSSIKESFYLDESTPFRKPNLSNVN